MGLTAEHEPASASHIASLTRSLAAVPAAAIPAIIDCVLASAPSLSAAELFFSLLNSLTDLVQDELSEKRSKLDSAQSNLVVTHVHALFHLIKDSRTGYDAFGLLIWKGLVPLLQVTDPSDKEFLKEMEEVMCDAVLTCQSWELMEETLVPVCLRSVGHFTGMPESHENAIFPWSRELPLHWRSYELNTSCFLPPLLACRFLISLLDASLRAECLKESQRSQELKLVDESRSPCSFTCNLIWDLSYIIINMLSEGSEQRSCAIRLLLPSLFKAFTVSSSCQVRVHGLLTSFRICFFDKIWKCCLSLFSLGRVERRDAYSILALYYNYFSNDKEGQDVSDAEFDIILKKEFWHEIHRGLVDSDATSRKLSLYILKICVGNLPSDASGCTNGAMNGFDGNLGSTKRGKWADKEAKSLGVGEYHDSHGKWNAIERWQAFFLLYEMLEEYGTHLVEAAWTHQVNLLFQSELSIVSSKFETKGIFEVQMETLEGIFGWLTILWERGFSHENPQVRCLIMEYFLNIQWEKYRSYAGLVPEPFILGPFVHGLNDIVHHRDFGIKGVYTSSTIQGARTFLCQYCSSLSRSLQARFLCRLASIVKHESFGRAGLMSLAFCLSASCDTKTFVQNKANYDGGKLSDFDRTHFPKEDLSISDCSNLLDALGVVIERSKQHFNPNYRRQVCEQVLIAACSVMKTSDVPVDVLLHFISTIPQEFTDINGPLRSKLQKWFLKNEGNCIEIEVLNDLYAFPSNFIKNPRSPDAILFDDEDLSVWGSEAERWARVFFLLISTEQQLDPIFMFLEKTGNNIAKTDTQLEWIPVKFFIITLHLIGVLLGGHAKAYSCDADKTKDGVLGFLGQLPSELQSSILERFQRIFFSFLDDLLEFTNSSCNVFWYDVVAHSAALPSSITGKLGGPVQRRLDSHKKTAVLEAILSIKMVAAIFSWGMLLKDDIFSQSLFPFMWNFSWKVILSPKYHSEAGAEIQLAAYEALVPVFEALLSAFSPSFFDFVRAHNNSLHPEVGTPLLDPLLLNFLKSINDQLVNGMLTRSRRAVLMNWKWFCLNSLLSIRYEMKEHRVQSRSTCAFFSHSSLEITFLDVVESLENAGETSALPLLKIVRSMLRLFGSSLALPAVSSGVINFQMMQKLVHSSWLLHVNCNKRHIAPIAALLSSILHPSIFGDLCMHETDENRKGPLRWFIEVLIEEGTKSPRTIRLAACHLTGLWYSYPRVIKYYIKELKLLSLYGSVAFDEDFEAELSENNEAKTEVSLLAQCPFGELMEEYINTEMYARICVALLFHKLADVADNVQHRKTNEDACAALATGKMFLLELLDSVVNESDLAKELYKKFSAVHRRKVRAWQMICVLYRYVEEDIVQKVTTLLHICLYRNNFPAVRQYLETFAIQVYLKFPKLIEEQLIPIFRGYNMRPQALSSYVFIAANIIIHSGGVPSQVSHLNTLLPPIIPLLTSHHHSLRGITQVLVYYVLSKLVPTNEPKYFNTLSLERKCFEDLKFYLSENVDCARLRSSMEGFLDSFDPTKSCTPAGVFNANNKASDFECVPLSLMEQVNMFLNDVREGLRDSMSKDMIIIKNESLKAISLGENTKISETMLDFQKKVTLHKHEKQSAHEDFYPFSGHLDFPKSLIEMENEDLLLSQLTQSRSQAMKQFRESRQQFILVASLLDRIPNLAGLARTCEVFKATAITVADKSILQDKQFQLISVTAEKWVPIIEVPVSSMKFFLERKKHEGFSILGLEQTANSTPLDQYSFPTKTVLVLGREKEGIPVDIIHVLDACVEIPQLGVIRSLNVHVSGAIALWEYTRQQRCRPL